MEGPDIFQHSDVILLCNVAALFFISIGTDYWLFRTYDFERLITSKLLHCSLRNSSSCPSGTEAPSIDWTKYTGQELLIVEQQCKFEGEFSSGRNSHKNCVANARRALIFNEHSGVFQTCNELQNYRRREIGPLSAGEAGLRCYAFSSDYNWWMTKPSSYPAELAKIAVAAAYGAIVCILFCLASGIIGAIRVDHNLLSICGATLALFAALHGAVIACEVLKLNHRKTASLKSTLPSLSVSPFVTYNYQANRSKALKAKAICHQCITRILAASEEHVHYSLGWSFGSGVVTLVLAIIASYIFIATGCFIRHRRNKIRRSQLVKTSIALSCRQDVALAVRAKIIVEDEGSTDQ